MFDNIAAQDVAITAGEELQPVKRGVRAFVFAVGVAVGHETGIKNRLDDVAQGVMYHAVTKRRGADLAALGRVDEEMMVVAGFVAVVGQFAAKHDQPVCDPLLEPGSRRTSALAFGGLAKSQQQVRPVYHGSERYGR